jgi:hypothetical protein
MAISARPDRRINGLVPGASHDRQEGDGVTRSEDLRDLEVDSKLTTTPELIAFRVMFGSGLSL